MFFSETFASWDYEKKSENKKKFVSFMGFFFRSEENLSGLSDRGFDSKKLMFHKWEVLKNWKYLKVNYWKCFLKKVTRVNLVQ